MAANTKPIFAKKPVLGIASLVSPTAVTSRANIAGTTNLALLLAAGNPEGSEVRRIEVQAKETTVAGVLFVWIYNGTTSYLWDEIVVSAVTPSNTAAAFRTYREYPAGFFPDNMDIYVSSTIDQDFNVFAFGGDY